MHWEKKGQTLGQTNTNVRKLKSENAENSNCVKEKPKAANKKNVSKNKCVCASKKNSLLQCWPGRTLPYQYALGDKAQTLCARQHGRIEILEYAQMRSEISPCVLFVKENSNPKRNRAFSLKLHSYHWIRQTCQTNKAQLEYIFLKILIAEKSGYLKRSKGTLSVSRKPVRWFYDTEQSVLRSQWKKYGGCDKYILIKILKS